MDSKGDFCLSLAEETREGEMHCRTTFATAGAASENECHGPAEPGLFCRFVKRIDYFSSAMEQLWRETLNQEYSRCHRLRFREGSRLLALLAAKDPASFSTARTDCRLTDVFRTLRRVISEGRLFARGNPEIVLCDSELEEALDVSALHVADLKNWIFKQATELPLTCPFRDEQARGHAWLQRCVEPLEIFCVRDPAVAREEKNVLTVPTWTLDWSWGDGDGPARLLDNLDPRHRHLDVDGSFRLSPKLEAFVRTLPEYGPEQTAFCYRTLCHSLSRYILSRDDRFFDLRNVRVAVLKGDPLGEALEMEAVARSQITCAIRTLLLPLPEEPGPSAAESAAAAPAPQQPDARPDSDAGLFPPSGGAARGPDSTAPRARTPPAEEHLPGVEDSPDESDSAPPTFAARNRFASFSTDSEEEPTPVPPADSSTEDDSSSEDSAAAAAPVEEGELPAKKPRLSPASPDSDCNICFQAPKDTAFVHGRLAHLFCCYPCAKRLFKMRRPCPLCRRTVEKIARILG
jgi:hypothetical protein